jgi:hypothetical protein
LFSLDDHGICTQNTFHKSIKDAHIFFRLKASS